LARTLLGFHDAPTEPLVGWGGDIPLPIPHSTRRIDLVGDIVPIFFPVEPRL